MVKYKNFLITENKGKLDFKNLKTGQEKNGVKIVFDRDYIYKVQKSQIKTKYSTATEFIEWMQSLIDENFATAHIATICKMYVGECDYDFV